MAHTKKAANGTWTGVYNCQSCANYLNPLKRRCNGHSDGLSGFATKTEAHLAAISREVAVREGRAKTPDGKPTVTLNEVFDIWFDSGPKLKNPDWYRDIHRAGIAPALGEMPVSEIDSPAVHWWIQRLRKDGLSQSTLKSNLGVLRKTLDFAVTPLALRKKNPASEMKVPKSLQPDPEPVKPFTRAEVGAIADTIDPRYKALVEVGAFCGCRIGELSGVRRDDIENIPEVGSVIHIRRQLQKGRFVTPKTKAGIRTVPIPLVVQDSLLDHLEMFPPEDNEERVIFSSPTGQLLHYRNFSQRFWYPTLDALGLDRRGVHALRHSFIRFGKDAGVPGHILAALAGQKDLAVTMAYGQGTELSDLAEKINKLTGVAIGSQADKIAELVIGSEEENTLKTAPNDEAYDISYDISEGESRKRQWS